MSVGLIGGMHQATRAIRLHLCLFSPEPGDAHTALRVARRRPRPHASSRGRRLRRGVARARGRPRRSVLACVRAGLGRLGRSSSDLVHGWSRTNRISGAGNPWSSFGPRIDLLPRERGPSISTTRQMTGVVEGSRCRAPGGANVIAQLAADTVEAPMRRITGGTRAAFSDVFGLCHDGCEGSAAPTAAFAICYLQLRAANPP